MLGKNRRKELRKNAFYIHTNIVTKKCSGKKSSQKRPKKRFLYSHEYSDQKMMGKKLAKQFSQKHTNDSKKNVGKKIVAKK